MIEMRLEPFEFGLCAGRSSPRAAPGVAEVIYCAGKTPEQTRGITQACSAAARRTYCSPACAPSTMRPCAI